MSNRTIVVGLLAICIATAAGPLAAQTPRLDCEGIFYSTEEDFVTRGPRPADGNPVISDGDLLALTPAGGARVCARNRDLLGAFESRADLGLDAVDVIDFPQFVIAFSTELDDPGGGFSAGDLLLTSGGVVPNAALLHAFDLRVPRDLGLDAVHLIGSSQGIRELVDAIGGKRGGDWRPGELSGLLEQLRVDIWFSTEGTALPLDQPAFLDGDLLSARTGSIVARNSLLLPDPQVPAGIPERGVDFGLDAATAEREADRESIHFSTEILFRGRPAFTDGDILRLGAGVAIPHFDLIAGFEPMADFVGLDALHFVPHAVSEDPKIQTLCGLSHLAIDFDGGQVQVEGPGTGLYGIDPRRPCGRYVPIDGFLPDTGIERFRVAYRPDGDPALAPGIAPGIVTEWTVFGWSSGTGACDLPATLVTDASGWMDASDYVDWKDGSAANGWCSNSGLQLAVWQSHSAPDPNGHYVVWLEWEPSVGPLVREPFDHHIQLDNVLPVIAPHPAGLEVRLPGGGPNDVVPVCGEAPAGMSQFEVWGQFADLYYWNFRLELRGGLPPDSETFGPHDYYDLDDGTPTVKNTDDTGTVPDSTTVRLRDIDLLAALEDSFQDCCYVIDLWVRDAAIRHNFNHIVATDVSGALSFQTNAFVTFAAGP